MGLKIVFTNGCFDILHAGHMKLLCEARSFGDRLVVGVNTDASVRRLKGRGRPVVPLVDRCAVLEAVRWVDLVIPFAQETPARLIEQVRPDVLVKGAEYRGKEIVGAEFVQSYGGRVELVGMARGKSSSGILALLKKRPASKG
jgi:D-beta-D-heptose 7-phosphate kinase/D-beta-D-heptose 1-phosphate adenosyltransferase